jgi:L-iditol 2-dehydrogenase
LILLREANRAVSRGRKICLAAFPHEKVQSDIAQIVRNNVYVYGIRGERRSATHRAMALLASKRFDATLVHTHTFALSDLQTALHYAATPSTTLSRSWSRRGASPRCG